MSLYEWGLSVPWCMTSAALDLMLALAAREEVTEDELKQAMHGPKSLALRDGRRRDDSATMTTVDGVARIVIDGPIYRYADYFTKYSGGVTTEALAKDVQKAIDDPAVAAIAFIIDSPGGEATAINELADTIYAARGRKPIGAYIEGYGASAAYWIASAADVVVVDDNALVGSIGTVMGVLDPAKQVRRTIEFVSTQSPKKRVDPTTDDGKKYLQQLVDDMTEVFVGRVMRNRSLSREQVLAVGGGLLIGQQAIDAGLADRLGAEDQLLRELAAKAAERTPFLLPPARVPSGQPLRMEAPMDWKAFWNGMFGAAAEAEGTPVAAAIEPADESALKTRTVQVASEHLAQAAAQAQGVDARDERLKELEKQLAQQRDQQITKDAQAFADSAIRDRRAMPAERSTLIRLYTSAAQDDARNPWPSPQDASEAASRVALLQADIATRPQHTLLEERVAVGAGGVLEANAKPTELSEARRKQLLSMTPSGQAVLARKAKSA